MLCPANSVPNVHRNGGGEQAVNDRGKGIGRIIVQKIFYLLLGSAAAQSNQKSRDESVCFIRERIGLHSIVLKLGQNKGVHRRFYPICILNIRH